MHYVEEIIFELISQENNITVLLTRLLVISLRPFCIDNATYFGREKRLYICYLTGQHQFLTWLYTYLH